MTARGCVVWVVENGCYSDRYIEGVYESIEAVVAAYPIPADYPFPAERTGANMSHPGGWKPYDASDPMSDWSNQLDWGDALQASPMVVKGIE